MVPPTLEELVGSLSTRFERVEQAILGDVSIGHDGLVTRMTRVEQEHRDVPNTHREMERSREAGDRRTHEHIEKVSQDLASKIEMIEDSNAEDSARIEKKIDRLVWIVVGASAVITGGGSWAFLAG